MFKMFKKKTAKKEQTDNTSYVNWWLFRDKGTVAEPWPTGQELWDDPEVQKELEAIKEVMKNISQSNSKFLL